MAPVTAHPTVVPVAPVVPVAAPRRTAASANASAIEDEWRIIREADRALQSHDPDLALAVPDVLAVFLGTQLNGWTRSGALNGTVSKRLPCRDRERWLVEVSLSHFAPGENA